MNYNNQTAIAACQTSAVNAPAGWTCSNCNDFVLGSQPHTCPTVLPLNEWQTTGYTHENEKVALQAAMLAFEKKLAECQIQMPPEFAELVEKHFWDLV